MLNKVKVIAFVFSNSCSDSVLNKSNRVKLTRTVGVIAKFIYFILRFNFKKKSISLKNWRYGIVHKRTGQCSNPKRKVNILKLAKKFKPRPSIKEVMLGWFFSSINSSQKEQKELIKILNTYANWLQRESIQICVVTVSLFFNLTLLLFFLTRMCILAENWYIPSVGATNLPFLTLNASPLWKAPAANGCKSKRNINELNI